MAISGMLYSQMLPPADLAVEEVCTITAIEKPDFVTS